MKIKIYLLLITFLCVTLSGCSKKTPPSTTPADSNQSSEPEPPKQRKADVPKLEYVDEIEKLALEIAAIMDSIETLEDAEEAVQTLRPLGREYRQLHKTFSRHYMQNGGPFLNKLMRRPKAVQRAVMLFLQKTWRLEGTAVYNLYGKNLPKKMKFKVADTAHFRGMSLIMDRKTWENWKERIDAPYIPPSNTVDPNTMADPNSLNEPNIVTYALTPSEPNSIVDPNSLVDPNRP